LAHSALHLQALSDEVNIALNANGRKEIRRIPGVTSRLNPIARTQVQYRQAAFGLAYHAAIALAIFDRKPALIQLG
jgi:hypothetical protein